MLNSKEHFHLTQKKGGTRKKTKNTTRESVVKLTDSFIRAVTKSNSPKQTRKLFCEKGVLIGTLSRITRRNKNKYNIENYFDYFAKIKGINVVSKKYDIQKIKDNIYLNQATITWKWNAIKKPVIARMTFIVKGNCIYLLHSSSMPPISDKVK